MWTPADLLTDLDLLAIDRLCLSDFNVTSLADKRRAAMDWLAPRVEQAGYKLWQHAVRKAPDAVFGYTGYAYTDFTSAALDTTDADLALSSVVLAPATDALYVGSRDPFKGLYVGIADRVNTNSTLLDVSVWTGKWTTVTSLIDGTQATARKSCSGGGMVTWQPPDTWTKRSVNNSLLYWGKVTFSSSLSPAAAAGQLTPIAASRLTFPAAHYALGLLYQESYGSQRGQWLEKADKMFAAAEGGLAVALPLIADEFDVTADGVVSREEVSSVTPNTAYLTTWERG
jgi:hypothetical protein